MKILNASQLIQIRKIGKIKQPSMIRIFGKQDIEGTYKKYKSYLLQAYNQHYSSGESWKYFH